MALRTTELQTKLASSALAQKLTEAGFETRVPEDKTLMSVHWAAEQLATFIGEMSRFMMNDWLYAYIEGKLLEEHPYLSDDEREYVALLTFHGLRKSDELLADRTFTEWSDQITEAALEVLTQAENFDVDGFLRFRARGLLSVSREAIADMVEQFLADREYEEFVSMLRFMLDAQPETPQVLNVFCSEDRVWISDAEGELIRDSEVMAAAHDASDDGDVNAEDLAMSILITRSPKQIVVHDMSDAAPWPSFSETIERVFLERAVRCNDCRTCRELRQANGFGATPPPSAMPGPFD